MLKDIVEVEVLTGYKLKLRFEDGVEGEIDVSKLVEFRGVFEPLAEPAYFRQVAIYEEGGTVYWPNGADLDPDVLYSLVSGEELPHYKTISSGSQTD